MNASAETKRVWAQDEADAFARYVGHAIARMQPLACPESDAELYSYRLPGSERPCVLKRLATGHWLIRVGYAEDTDPEPWHRIRSAKTREVLKAARKEAFNARR